MDCRACGLKLGMACPLPPRPEPSLPTPYFACLQTLNAQFPRLASPPPGFSALRPRVPSQVSSSKARGA